MQERDTKNFTVSKATFSKPTRRIKRFIAIIVFTLQMLSAFCCADSTVVFNEIMYHPQTNEVELEWLELYNQMAVDMDISGWYVTGGIKFTFPEGTVVQGGGFLVLAINPGALETATGFQGAYGPFEGRLENGGELIELRNNNDRLMDSVKYSDGPKWPAAADGSGVSLAKRDLNISSGPPENWTGSEQTGGTPGAINFSISAGPVDSTADLVSYWDFDEKILGEGEYLEDFNDEPDGDPVDWVPFQGDAQIQSGELRLSASAGTETFAWAGVSGTPLFFGDIRSVSFHVNFAGKPGDDIGRHGGMVICCSEPTERWAGSMSGYMIDWIDRTGDHGYRVIKMTDGVHSGLGVGSGGTDPGSEWKVEFNGNSMTFSVDGVEKGTYSDSTYRNGYVGLWCYQNAGQEILFDDVRVKYTGLAFDLTGGNNGTVGSSSIATDGFVGSGALAFDNSQDSFVNVGPGDGNNFSVTDGITIEALIKTEWSAEPLDYDIIFQKDDGEKKILLAFQNDGITGNRDVEIVPDQQPVLSFGVNSTGTYGELDMPLDGTDGRPSLSDLKDGNPHYVAATYDSSTGFKAIYIDGQLSFSTELTPGSPVESGGSADAYIGNSEGLDQSFKGVIDEVAFWKRALPPGEVERHYNNFKSDHNYFLLSAEEEKEFQGPVLRFNETLLSDQVDSWVELVNLGNQTMQLKDFVLVNSADTAAGEYVFPGSSLSPGDFLLLTESQLGFDLHEKDKLFIYSPDRTSVVASVVLEAGLRGRYGAERWKWGYPLEATPGSENHFAFEQGIVISEIMYHPMYQPDDEAREHGEYVEIYNRGNSVVDLSGYKFVDGIEYVFPAGSSLAPGAYLVIAGDPSWIKTEYNISNVVGPFLQRLSNGGEHVRLVDPLGNPVDDVPYFDGGWWPKYADGGGSSLELRDVWADNSKPGAWAASDESTKSQWNQYSYQGIARSNRGPTLWKEFVLGLLAKGEILLDDISVVESPGGNEIEFLQNGNFETGASQWRIIGNHRMSEVIEDPDSPGNHVLHLVALGATEHMHNHAETTFADNQSVVNGRTYRISFRAKWIAGSNLLNTRLYFNRLPRTTPIMVPDKRGTPGGPNSVTVENIGPTYSGLRHYPAVPEPDQEVSVTVFAGDPDGVKKCTLYWAVNGESWTSRDMIYLGGDKWRGTIPGQSKAKVVQFYIEGEDERGAVSAAPPHGPDSRALYKVNDGQARFEHLHNLRIVMLSSDTDFMHLPTNVMSNEHLGATVIYDEKEVFYDVGVRLRSSERGRLNSSRVGYNISFNPDHLFRGVHDSLSVDRAGGVGLGMSVSQDEIIVKHIINHAGGIPGMYDDIIRIIAPRSNITSNALLLMARFNKVYLRSQYENGEDGRLYTYELIYYPTTTSNGRPDGLKLPQPDRVIGVDIQDLGDDKEAYRWFFLTENNRDEDDYSGLMKFCKKFAAPSAQLEEAAAEVMDVNEWMRTFAMYSLCGIGDTYSQGLEHNNMEYVRPSDGRVLVLPWDMDFAFFQSTSANLWGNDNISRIIALSPYRRMFYLHLNDIMETTFNRPYLDSWIDHYGVVSGRNYGAVKNYISQRSAFVKSRLPLGTAFEISKVDNQSVTGDEVSVEADSTSIEGRAPFTISGIRLNGEVVDVKWKSVIYWTMEVALQPGPNTFEFVGVDLHENVLGTVAITITSTLNWNPPRVFSVMPANGPDTGGKEVILYGENFQDGMRVWFGEVEAPSVTYSSPMMVTVLSPAGTGSVEIKVKNPDGLTGTATDIFTYISTEKTFMRADVNIDGNVDIADAVTILGYLFGGSGLSCVDAADVNDDGALDLADAISLLSYSFADGLKPPEPFEACGVDPTNDGLKCESFNICK